MPKQFDYTSMLRIFTKIERDFGLVSYNEFDVIEWTGEALEAIGTVNQYEEAVAFIEVKNHQCTLPRSLTSVIQVARNRKWDNAHKGCCPQDIINTCCTTTIPTGTSPVMINSCGQPAPMCPNNPVIIDCHGTPITDYELAYYRPFFDLQAFYFGWCNSSLYRSFTPVRLANNVFFNSLVCRETDENIKNLYSQCNDEYTPIDKTTLRFSFRDGQVAVAYNRQKLDEDTGYPMIPDMKSVIDAIAYYVQWKIQTKEYYNSREGAGAKMKEAEGQYIHYCRQAGNELMQPTGVDDYQDMLDMMKYLVPQKDRYFGFFGNLTKPENTLQYDDPDRRNMLNSFFRGI